MGVEMRRTAPQASTECRGTTKEHENSICLALRGQDASHRIGRVRAG